MELPDAGPLLKTLLKVVLPLIVIAIVLFAAKRRQMSLRDDLGIRQPASAETIAEELLFRGFLFSRLLRTRLGVIGTIVVLAAVWALMHVDYSASVIALLFVAGMLGTARYRTKSVIVPVLMHITWNLYAVW